MTFLSPVTGLILAGVTMPLLTLMYILKLRRQSLRVSSIVFWKAARSDLEVNVPWRRLRLSLLYVLQMLALACLCIAAAEPVDDGQAGRGARVVVVIDHSASMNTRLEPGARGGAREAAREEGAAGGESLSRTRLDEAKRRATRLVDELLEEGGTEVGVAAVSLEGRLLVRPTRDRSAVLEGIDAIEPTDQPGSREGIIQAIAAAELVRRGARGSGGGEAGESDQADADAGGGARAFVLSDGVLAGVEGVEGVEGSEGSELPAGVAIRYVPIGVSEAMLQEGQSGPGGNGPGGSGPGGSGPGGVGAMVAGDGNLGIVSIAAVRERGDVNNVRLTVQIGGVVRGPTTAGVEVVFAGFGREGKGVGQGSLQLVPADGTGRVLGTLPMAVRLAEGGVLTARLRGDDALASDDAGSVVLPAGRSLRVWAVGNLDDQGGVEIDPFLRSFAEASGAEFEVMDAGTFARRAEAKSAAGNAREMAVDLALLDRVEPPRGAIGSGIPIVSFGAGFGARGLEVTRAREEGERAAADQVVTWRRGDGLMRDVRPSSLEIRRPAWFASVPARGRVLIETGRGAAAVLLEPEGRGAASVHVAFALRDSNWGADASLVLFLSNLLEQLGSVGRATGASGDDGSLGAGGGLGGGGLGTASRAGQSVTTRDVVSVNMSQARGEIFGPVDVMTLQERAGVQVIRRELGVVSERGESGGISSGGAGRGAVVSAGILQRAGVYVVQQAGLEDSARGVVAVNLASAAESEVWVRRILPLGESRGRQIEASREPRALWRIFVMLALGLAMLEWMMGVLLLRR